jgi:hypothetical protein
MQLEVIEGNPEHLARDSLLEDLALRFNLLERNRFRPSATLVHVGISAARVRTVLGHLTMNPSVGVVCKLRDDEQMIQPE